eukprot:1800726-Rhodomonas_salina.1
MSRSEFAGPRRRSAESRTHASHAAGGREGDAKRSTADLRERAQRAPAGSPPLGPRLSCRCRGACDSAAKCRQMRGGACVFARARALPACGDKESDVREDCAAKGPREQRCALDLRCAARYKCWPRRELPDACARGVLNKTSAGGREEPCRGLPGAGGNSRREEGAARGERVARRGRGRGRRRQGGRQGGRGGGREGGPSKPAAGKDVAFSGHVRLLLPAPVTPPHTRLQAWCRGEGG